MKSTYLPFEFINEHRNPYTDFNNDDVLLLEKPIISSVIKHPVKLEVTVAIVCLKGTSSGRFNMRHHVIESPCLLILMAGQTVEFEFISEDFSAIFLLMSKRFSESLKMEERVPALLSLYKKPYVELGEHQLHDLLEYFKQVKRALSERDNPYRIKIIQHITKAYFYHFGYYAHLKEYCEHEQNLRHDEILEKFLNALQTNYIAHRNLAFYADLLCLSPRYLSKIIKDNSGLSASEWIEEYVMLEAKALLKSTDLTIQQISDRLNFASQSFFGKYFKRVMGISPSVYRET